MARWIPFVLALLVAEGAFAAPPLEAPSEPGASAQEAGAPGSLPAAATSELEERNAELLKKHAEVWGLMGLSARAQEELNASVVSINAGIHENRKRRPEAFEQAMVRRRSDEPLTYQGYLAGHVRRFALLKISEPTQEELRAALSFTWRALHDPEVPAAKREVAEQIRDLMKSMGGPPPCCDDSIFERAGMADWEP
jgi:hypothetical protein